MELLLFVTITFVLVLACMAVAHIAVWWLKFERSWEDIVEGLAQDFKNRSANELTVAERVFMKSTLERQREVAWSWRLQGILVTYLALMVVTIGICAVAAGFGYSREFFFAMLSVVALVTGVLAGGIIRRAYEVFACPRPGQRRPSTTPSKVSDE